MQKQDEELTDKIFTVANFITVSRFLLVPIFVYLVLQNQNIYAFLVFIIASITDGLDGFVARATHTCSKLGKILDPIADRVMIVVIAITLFVVGRIPLWILILIALRDVLMLLGGLIFIKKYQFKINVIFLGKVATAILYVGFASLILVWPVGTGLGWFDVSWLPGFGHDMCFYGIFLIYISLILNIYTTGHYINSAFKVRKKHKESIE